MKIAILTLPLHANYGGIMQAYALQCILERMGHNVTVLDGARLPQKLKLSIRLKRFILSKIFLKKIFSMQQLFKEKSVICSNTWKFVDSYIHYRTISNFSEIGPNEYDAFIVGSDQVWRPRYFENGFCCTIENAFLKFAQSWNVKRIAYSTSFGTNVWEYSPRQTKKCLPLIQKFDAISVREFSAMEMLNSHLKSKSVQTVDPTMLLERDDYLCLLKNNNFQKKYELVSYVLDESKDSLALEQHLMKKLNLAMSKLNVQYESAEIPLENRIQLPVENWLYGLQNADFVVTDSFHACVFSIIFEKPFLVLVHEKHGKTRLDSLLSMFGLEDRLVVDVNSFDLDNVKSSISRARTLLKEKRNEGLEFLKSALN